MSMFRLRRLISQTIQQQLQQNDLSIMRCRNADRSFAPTKERTDDQRLSLLMAKLKVHIKRVKVDSKHTIYIGSFMLITGVFKVKPIPFAVADAVTSGAIPSFAKTIGCEMPLVIRVNSINPTVLKTYWGVCVDLMPGSFTGQSFA